MLTFFTGHIIRHNVLPTMRFPYFNIIIKRLHKALFGFFTDFELQVIIHQINILIRGQVFILPKTTEQVLH